MNHTTKPIKITIKEKNTDKEQTFNSIRKASEYMGISAIQLSRIIRGTRNNLTKYYVTTD